MKCYACGLEYNSWDNYDDCELCDCGKGHVHSEYVLGIKEELDKYQRLHADKVLYCVELEKRLEHLETLQRERNERE